MTGRLLIFAALLAGCAEGGDPPLIDAAPIDADPNAPPDLSSAKWELEPVAGSGDSGFVPALSFTGDGRAVAVWQLNDASAIGFAIREGNAWFVQMITAANTTGVFTPDIAGAAGGVAHIVFSGTTTATGTDIFYVRADGSSLSQPINLTAPNQGASDTDSSPTVASTPDSEVTVLYSYTTDSMGLGPSEVRALTFTNPGLPQTPETVLESTQDCGQPRARIAPDGSVHAIAVCNPTAADQAVYVTNRGGSFTSQTADVGSDTVIAPDLDVGSDGSVHIVVQGSIPCPEGTCSEPLYSLNLAPAAAATGGTEDFFSPAIALDAFDRPIIVFFDLPGRELYWTFNEGEGFFRPQQVDPSGGKLAGTGADDPVTGLPWFVFEERNSSPAIWVAKLVP